MKNGIYESIELGIEGKVATITLKRPETRNALNPSMLEELLSALTIVRESASIRALLITGEGKGFCSGADLSANGLPTFQTEERQAVGEATYQGLIDQFNPLVRGIYEMPKPVIAAVNGAAAGAGASLALACDIVIAAESAYFAQVFVPKLGIIPDLGSTWLLPRLIGSARAKASMLLGEKIMAAQAEEWGMIYQQVPDNELMSSAKEKANRLADGATFGIGQFKTAMLASPNNDFVSQLQLEAEIQKNCCSSSDFVEGVTAFINKRQPEFTGEEHATEDQYPGTTQPD